MLVQPYMCRHHGFYESRPHSIIFTLEGHPYRIPEVVLTILLKKQHQNVISHTANFSLFMMWLE
jgi:hypothetical protein